MKKLILLLLICIACNTKKEKTEVDFKIGIIADCQYCNCDTAGKRFYKNSTAKLKTAVDTLSNKQLAYTFI